MVPNLFRVIQWFIVAGPAARFDHVAVCILEQGGIDAEEMFLVGRHLVIVSNGVDWTDRLTNTAFDTLRGVNVKHPFAFVDAIDRAGNRTRPIFHIYARAHDYEGHCHFPSQTGGRFS